MKSENRTLNFFLNMGLLGFSLLFFEFALQVANVFFVWWEYDSRGFRNPTALDSATIVALGDSHTRGTSVNADKTWPRKLSAKLGEDIYNMALGGYGPVRNNDNLSIAMGLNPSWVIFGLYFGNDFYDDFRLLQKKGDLSKYASADVLSEISELENHKTIAEEVGHLFVTGGENKDAATNQAPSEDSGPPGFLSIVRKWLTNHSKL